MFSSRLNDATSDNAANTAGAGFFTTCRSASGAYEKYKDGASFGSPAVASTALPTGHFTIFRDGATYSSHQLIFASAGAALTAGEVAAFYDALNAYKTAVGA